MLCNVKRIKRTAAALLSAAIMSVSAVPVVSSADICQAAAVPKTKFTEVYSTSNSVTLKWKKAKCSGYQIVVYKGSKKEKTVKVKNKNTVKKKIKGLKADKKYTFKIRSYKKSKSGKLSYSAFSKTAKFTAPSVKKWKAAYKSKLYDIMREESSLEHTFRLVYIDNDSAPELVVFPKAEYHAAVSYVYKYVDGKIIKSQGGEYSTFVYKEFKNRFKNYWYGMGLGRETILKYDGNKVKGVVTVESDQYYGDQPCKRFVNGKLVSKEKFIKVCRKYDICYSYNGDFVYEKDDGWVRLSHIDGTDAIYYNIEEYFG